MKRPTCLLAFLILNALAMAPEARASRDSQHLSVKAAFACIEKIAPIVKKRQPQGRDIACDIPVSLSESDLDELFKAALRTASMGDRVRGAAEKYSATIAKTVTNFRSADCLIKLRVKRSVIIEALSRDKVTLQLPDQPADCDVTTKNRKIKKLKFAFSPQVEMVKGCVNKFALNMGKIDADCRICYFNRLYLSTKLIGLWANQQSGNARRILNTQLGASCASN